VLTPAVGKEIISLVVGFSARRAEKLTTNSRKYHAAASNRRSKPGHRACPVNHVFSKIRRCHMATASSLSLTTRSSLLRPIVLGGMFIFISQFIHQWVVITLIQKTPYILVWQYIASGALGNAAFEGGIATALVGVLIHFFISLAIAGVFILSAGRLPLLRRYAIAGALLYGFGVFIVMNMIVTPLSAAPPLPAPTMPWLIEAIIEHVVIVGLPLGILVRRNASASR
jgi:hypothetical protein